jgi:hypothetical protein
MGQGLSDAAQVSRPSVVPASVAMLSDRTPTLAGVRIRCDGDSLWLMPAPDWTRACETGLASFLALSAVMVALGPARHWALLLIAAILLWVWIAATAGWQPILRLRRRLTIRWPERSYRDASPPCELAADDRLLDIRQVKAVGVAVANVLLRYAPSYGVYLVSNEVVVHVAETRREDQAMELARLIQAELTPDANVIQVKGAPSPGWGPACAALLVSAPALIGIYLVGVALMLNWSDLRPNWVRFAPERAVWIGPATAVLLVVVAVASRLAIQRLFRPRTRASIGELFGVAVAH